MKKAFLLLLVFGALTAAAPGTPHWTDTQLQRLTQWMTASSGDGIATVSTRVGKLEQLRASGGPDAVDAFATDVAQQLLSDHINGCCNASLRADWHIANGLEQTDRKAAVASALANDELDQLFERARPSHPFYKALRDAFVNERDAGRRAILTANLDRWRWMPRQLGERYILVNTAAFEATLWQGGQMVGRWEVVVGKTKSPTPVFAATVSGVTINPWWEIPPAIAAESIAGLFAHDRAEAARRGYVKVGSRYRQRPGATNSLGRMKLVMPNAYNIYLHDTPAKALFGREIRAFSHGCVRVGDALGLATVLVGGQWDRAKIDALVETGVTQTIPLGEPIPVYIAYFTAEPDGLGGIRYFPDTYARDSGAKAPTPEGQCAR